jgi:homoserine kinase
MPEVRPQFDHYSIPVHGSTANLGPMFDMAAAALSEQAIYVACEITEGTGVEVDVRTTSPVPEGRQAGHAGGAALEKFLHDRDITQGVRLIYSDLGESRFPTGGLGLSAAEAVGAVVVANTMFEQKLSALEIAQFAWSAEPGEHKDNVLSSLLGCIVIAGENPWTKEVSIMRTAAPRLLGVATGISSHLQTGGTEAARSALKQPMARDTAALQAQNAVMAAVSLMHSDPPVDFLAFAGDDYLHERERAGYGLYGNFSPTQWREFKKGLYLDYGIGCTMSGAGPHVQLWYNRAQYPLGLPNDVKDTAGQWFGNHGVSMQIHENSITDDGAYATAGKKYHRMPAGG